MQVEKIKDLIKRSDLEGVKTALSGLSTEEIIAIKDHLGRGIVHWASRDGAIEILKWSIEEAKIPVDSLDVDGATGLMVASTQGHARCVEFLYSHGANVQLKQRFGSSAIDLARHKGHKGVLAILEEGKVFVDEENISDVATLSMDAQIQEMQGLIEKLSAPLRDATSVVIDINTSMDAPGSIDIVKNSPDASTSAPMPVVQDINIPEHVQKWSPEKQKAYRALMDLGFEDLTVRAMKDPCVGRPEDTNALVQMIKKGQNPLLVGEVGCGKSSTALLVAEQLPKEGRVLIQVPDTLLRGNKYAGSVNENLQKWIPHILVLQKEVALFIDETHVLSTGKTASDSTDTPTQVLRPYLDSLNSERRIVMLGAVSPKQADVLAEDENFYRLLSPYQLRSLTQKETQDMLKSSSTIERLIRQHYQIDDVSAYGAMVDQILPMLQKFIFNQSFPKKAFDFIQNALHDKPVSILDEEKIEQAFAKFFSIPIEVVRGEIGADSPYATLSERLQDRLMGQDHPIENLAAGVTSTVLLRSNTSRAPASFLMMGPTGVGKTEASEQLSKMLNLPILSFNMGEFKSINSINLLIDQLSEFLTKNYSGVILFDEIEKAHPQVLDVFLSLLDKGVVGSGNSKVYCGAQVVIGTTNIAANETMALKKAMQQIKNHMVIDEDWLRQRLIDDGMRPEIVNRFTKVLDFNHITPEIALKIGKSVFEKKSQELRENKSVSLVFDDEFIRKQIVDDFDDRFGARGIIRTVNEVFERIISNPKVMVRLRKNTQIKISETVEKQLMIDIKEPDGTITQVRLEDSKTNSKKDLNEVLNALKSMQQLVDSVAERSDIFDAPAQSKRISP